MAMTPANALPEKAMSTASAVKEIDAMYVTPGPPLLQMLLHQQFLCHRGVSVG
jgi:hypothetical protein